MKVTLTKEEKHSFFHSALCNGLQMMPGYGLELDYKQSEYVAARKKLDKPCLEDVFMQILKDGGSLTMKGDETNSVITIKELERRITKTPMSHLLDMHKEEDDANTADAILQTVFFKEIIFG